MLLHLTIARHTVSWYVARLFEDVKLEKEGDQFVITEEAIRSYIGIHFLNSRFQTCGLFQLFHLTVANQQYERQSSL